MSRLRTIVRWAYAPFLMLGLTAVAYWIVVNAKATIDYFWLLPLIGVAYLTAFAAERIAPFYPEWNEHHDHGDTSANIWHTVVYEISAMNGVLMIPLIQWMFPYPGHLADVVAALGSGTARVPDCRLRVHVHPLCQPPLSSALAPAFGASRCRPALRLQRRHPAPPAPDPST